MNGSDTELSDEAKHLAIRFLIGEINETQFNFLAHQKHFDKQALLLFIEEVRGTYKIVGFLAVTFLMAIGSLLVYLIFG